MPESLQGLRVLLTRPQGRGETLATLLEAQGAEVQRLPLQRIEPVGDAAEQCDILDRWRDAFGWIFTSTNAANTAAALNTGPWPPQYAIGPATAAALRRLDRGPVHLPPRGHTSEDLLAHPDWAAANGGKVLICTGEGGRMHLQDSLRKRGVEVRRLVLYRRSPLSHEPAVVADAVQGSDAIVCTSAEGLQALHEQTETTLHPVLHRRLLVVPSARVLELARRLGFTEVRIPSELSDSAWAESLAHPEPRVD